MKILSALKIYVAVLGLLLCTAKSFAQTDPHFSQYYANPLYLNPALTGVIDGDYRATVNFKQQWSALNSSFLTGGASFDMAPKKNFAFGATILNQRAGELDFNYLSALVSGSYRLRFGAEGLQMVSFGLQAGVINRSFDFSQARFGNQFNPISGYDGGMMSGETLSSQSSLVPDVNAGIMYFDGNPNKSVNVFLGASAAHLTRPMDRFSGSNSRIPVRFTAHGGARIKASELLDIVPNALFMYQGNTNELSVGAYAQLNVNPSANILFGGNYRNKDAAIAFVGLQLKNMVFGLSYDINTSTFNRASNSNGGLELSISLIGRNGLIGPNFFCPRL
ncbi:PorP/SprF family type IX secretion system membrane protein [Pedobacter sp. ISL-68]|uniref:PorP/SprF family type IX secretion system membrane protein n=1 Tax=unclassified Pedobacter TaxID=2628915 RepID=UPI001BEA08D2|nr:MULTISPECIES: PorP/SprF family type IX secretion system membrane protein [unclassified Pedobacter]MBT2561864.1 PorP/SprF family type IX secretion system membrane protein [Pedobacter sp. ISL-64]MBT2592522.1 PorP/SprF family type IX secretion system membrane protein [Pedobacter sp. ISL-68]